jgi:hypothetical protein
MKNGIQARVLENGHNRTTFLASADELGYGGGNLRGGCGVWFAKIVSLSGVARCRPFWPCGCDRDQVLYDLLSQGRAEFGSVRNHDNL